MTEPLHPVQRYFPDRSPRWVADYCRAGKIPGAVKIGRTWMVRESDIARLTAAKIESKKPHTLTVEEAMADLRRRGVV